MFSSENSNSSEVRLPAEKIDFLIVKHLYLSGEEESESSHPELRCGSCDCLIAYHFDEIDPLLSAFYCYYCDFNEIPENKLNSTPLEQIQNTFFVRITKETDDIYMLEQVVLGSKMHFETRLMSGEEEEGYYRKVLDNYRNKFRKKIK